MWNSGNQEKTHAIVPVFLISTFGLMNASPIVREHGSRMAMVRRESWRRFAGYRRSAPRLPVDSADLRTRPGDPGRPTEHARAGDPRASDDPRGAGGIELRRDLDRAASRPG